jgi:hypothetical protein
LRRGLSCSERMNGEKGEKKSQRSNNGEGHGFLLGEFLPRYERESTGRSLTRRQIRSQYG